MKCFFKIVWLVVITTFFASCRKDDAPQAEFILPYAVQYPIDIGNIEAFLRENRMIVSPDLDVTFERIATPNVNNYVSIMNQTTYPIKNKIVNSNGIDYKLYYLEFRQGIKDKPTRKDSIFVSYKGDYLRKSVEDNNIVKNNNFETTSNPTWFQMEPLNPADDVIKGWKEMFVLFKSGISSDGGSGQTNYSDFGAGVFFLPSALGYYNQSLSVIPAYSPLIFSYKLKGVKYTDLDRDTVLSRDEDINGDGNFTNDDTDGDGIQNYLDLDDDGDGAFTRNEVRKPTPVNPATQGASIFYPFNAVLIDNPATPLVNEYEPKGIPDASGDGTTTTRLRRHLDKNAKPPFTTY